MESNAAQERADTSDEIQPLTILDLPLELLTKIISNKCINLKDRINLRSTCTVMERAVGLSNYNRIGKKLRDLLIYQSNTCYRHGVSEWMTILSRDYEMKCKRKQFSSSRFSSYSHLMSRLFRRSFFKRIRISFSKKHETLDLFMNSLLELSKSLSCEYLFITVINNEEYDDRIFQIIDAIQIRKELILDLGTARVEKEFFLNLPPLNALEISSYHGSVSSSKTSETLAVDDSDFLCLISKTRHLTMYAEPSMSLEGLLEAWEIIKEDEQKTVRFKAHRNLIEKMFPTEHPEEIVYFYYYLNKNKCSLSPLKFNQ